VAGAPGARQVRQDVGRDNVFFVHVSLVPYIAPSGELKTKPTQHSVAALRSIGITPDAIVCRADREIPAGVKRKIASMCDVDLDAVATAVDAPSIYDIPKVLHREGLDAYVIRRLGRAVLAHPLPAPRARYSARKVKSPISRCHARPAGDDRPLATTSIATVATEIHEPVAAQPVAAQPVAAQPVAAQPVAGECAAAEPVTATLARRRPHPQGVPTEPRHNALHNRRRPPQPP
jgi:hypothetical protein